MCGGSLRSSHSLTSSVSSLNSFCHIPSLLCTSYSCSDLKSRSFFCSSLTSSFLSSTSSMETKTASLLYCLTSGSRDDLVSRPRSTTCRPMMKTVPSSAVVQR